MFGAIFNLVTCQTTVIFGKLKDGSLEINSLVYIKAMVSATETSSKMASKLCLYLLEINILIKIMNYLVNICFEAE